ncbi:restriction alleviation protein, Lar family [Xenorhabdus sp. Reich]|uniref:Restriction alleviation protein, Lar family n=1 Tax=Xenorhabdus littoralis TaxID=2582835 RepID=A0ABU4SLA6_9GAMM|nr:restriction alleviation protein, Lar family [Xenorhabdus sp. Reich]
MMAETNELRPCPFCNSEHTEMKSYSDDAWFFVQCTECNADGPEGHDHYSAIQAWNQRVENALPLQSK